MSNNELSRYAQGQRPISWKDRRVNRQAKHICDEVRIAGMEADGALALGAHIMESVVKLDGKRQALGGNEVTAAILVDIEMMAIQAAKNVQLNLYDGWHL